MKELSSISQHTHSNCQEMVKSAFKDVFGMEVDVTPVLPQPVDGMLHEPKETPCPHGKTFYVLPTINQIAQWAFRGIE